MATRPSSVPPGLLGKAALCSTPFVVAVALAVWGGSSPGTARGDVAAERASVGHLQHDFRIDGKQTPLLSPAGLRGSPSPSRRRADTPTSAPCRGTPSPA